MSGFLAASFSLLLTLLGDPAEACTCAPTHVQTSYCYHEIVLGVKFLGYTKDVEWRRYEIKTTKVYKGSGSLQNLQFLHTYPVENLCGYISEHPPEQEFIVTGDVLGSHVVITICSLIRPLAMLLPEQIQGLSQDYSKGCSCTIAACFMEECSDDAKSMCRWEDEKAERLTCMPQSPDVCSWV